MRTKALIILFTLVSIPTIWYWLRPVHYTRDAIVVSIEGDIIAFKDFNGEVWEYEEKSPNKPKEDSLVVLNMHDNNTDYTIYDDVIISYKLYNSKE